MFGRSKPEPKTAAEMIDRAVGKGAAKAMLDDMMQAPGGHLRRAVAEQNAKRMHRDR